MEAVLGKEGDDLLGVLRNLFDDNAREIKKLQKIVDQINALEPGIKALK